MMMRLFKFRRKDDETMTGVTALPDYRETLLFSHVSLNKSWRDGQE